MPVNALRSPKRGNISGKHELRYCAKLRGPRGNVTKYPMVSASSIPRKFVKAFIYKVPVQGELRLEPNEGRVDKKY